MGCPVCLHFQSEMERLERDHSEKIQVVNSRWLRSDERHWARVAERQSRLELETLQGKIQEHELRHRRKAS